MQKILVTGDSGGFGHVLIKKLLDSGYKVVGISSKTQPEIVDPNFEHIQCNLIESLPEIDYSEIDHVIYAHGLNVTGKFEAIGWEDFEKSQRINMKPQFELTKELIKAWDFDKKADHCLIQIGSVASHTVSPDEIPYHTAKLAVLGMWKSLDREYSKYRVRFCAVSPGLMDTPMGKQTVHDRPDVLDRIPLGILTSTEEVSNMVITILRSPAFIGNISINAGRHTSMF